MADWQDSSLTLFGRSDFRDNRTVFGIRLQDRMAHVYIVGKTGTGKTTFLETMIRQDLAKGYGVAVIDPHGDLFERVRTQVPASRWPHTLVFDVPSPDCELTFNPFEAIAPGHRPLAASAMLEIMKRLWPSYWGPRLEHLLRYAFFALLETPGSVMADVLRILLDDPYRRRVAQRLTNEPVRTYWLHDYEEYPKRFRAEMISPIESKIGAFLAHPTLQRVLSAPNSSVNLRTLMDSGGVLLVNVSKGRLGEDASALLGGLMVSSMGIAALTRADQPESSRRPFFVHVDEFQSFTTLSLASMLSELRKYRLGMTLAHQYLAQLEPDVREAVFGNAGTIVCFRVGAPDARVLAAEFTPEFEARDLTRLPNYHFYLKLMYRGAPSRPFSGETLQPFP